MNFKDKLTNRYNIIMLVIVLIVSTLAIKLAIMTIAEGDYYRDISDNKIVKDIYKPAIRGEIKDRNGNLLAGSKPSFTVQMLKDEVNKLKEKEKNKEFLTLTRLLEEDGAPYVDDFPIELNVFKYASEEDYDKEFYNPMDKVIDIIVEKSLLPEILKLYYINPDYDDHYEFIVFNKAINALKNKGMEIPILAYIENENLKIEFDEEKDITKFKEEHGLKASDSPAGSILQLIKDDKAAIRKIIDQSISRKLTYNLLVSKGLEENLIIDEYSMSFEEDHREQKRHLMKIFPEVTADSSAKDDFINIFYETSIKSFLEAGFQKNTTGKKEEFIYPGKILLDTIKKEDIDIPVKIIIGKDKTVTYEYNNDKKPDDIPAIDFLIEEISGSKVFEKFMKLDEIRPLAQKQLLQDEINPKISVSEEYEYVSINNLNKFYSGNKIPENSNPKEAFEHLRIKYGIDKNLSDYEARPIFVMYNQLAKQGYLAYQPVYIAYGIKESTVAKIEESIMNTNGINITIEPVRYYPEGEVAAHTLGYLGKISQPEEIKEYVEEKKYSPSSLIGKTGIEQSFEDKLKGQGGIKKVEVDSVGNSTQTIEEETSTPGDNIYLTLDLDLQKVAEESLEKTLKTLQKGGTYESKWGNYKFGINKGKGRPYKNATSGATVAIDVKTGKVLASVSYPAYDPNLFSTGINSTDWASLFPENEEDMLAPRPLYNIATQTAVQPGSIIKMLTGLTALEKGLSPHKTIRDMGYVTIGDSKPACLLWTTSRRTHGHENLYDALRDSCNYYFYSLAMGKNQRTGENIGVKLEIEDIIDMGEKFGLNDKTGIEINIPSESSGMIPNPKRKVANNKAILKSILNREIEKTFNKDYAYTEEDKEEVIEEIISWLDLEVELSYVEVMNRLRDLKINPDAKISHANRIDTDSIADAIKFTYIRSAGWGIQDTLGITIGEGQNGYTPMQMANYVAIIANGGYKRNLTLVDSVKNYNNTKSVYEYKDESERVELNDYEHLNDIKKGMLKVTKEGAYKSVFSKFPIDVGGKTGTAQNDNKNPITKETYDDFSWFVAFAPYDDPQIAVATVIFQGGSGGYASPMTRDIIAEYLGLNKEEEEDTDDDNMLRR